MERNRKFSRLITYVYVVPRDRVAAEVSERDVNLNHTCHLLPLNSQFFWGYVERLVFWPIVLPCGDAVAVLGKNIWGLAPDHLGATTAKRNYYRTN